MSNTSRGSSGVGFFGLLTIVFIALKLTGYIAWSWWAVTALLWVPALIAVIVALALMVGAS